MPGDPTDPRSLLDLLGVERVSGVRPLADGFGDARLWRVEHDGRSSILRVYPAHFRHIRDRELVAMRAIESVPVPRIEAVGEPTGLPAMLQSWCAGTTLLQALSTAPEDAWSLGIAFGRAQARIHADPVPESLQTHLARDWISWGISGSGPIDRALRECPVPRASILHLDYHPLNVMVAGGTISGVIDWANAAIGDARADFARTYSLLRWLPLPPGLTSQRGSSTLRRFRHGWAHGYRQEAGPLPDLALFMAWAAMVLVRDLAPKIDAPGMWITEQDIRRFQQIERSWTRRSGVAYQE